MVIVIMGVSGSGKTTVGQALAERLALRFYDADDFHPQENVEKMAKGTPLNDADRWPWLKRLRALIVTCLSEGQTAVLACSALKEKYRQILKQGNADVKIIYLKGSFDLFWERMKGREGHYMKANMLQSQFDALEEPTSQEAITISADQNVAAIVDEIVATLSI